MGPAARALLNARCMNRLIPVVVLLSVSTCEAAGQPSETAIWVERTLCGVQFCAPRDRRCPVMRAMTCADGFTQMLMAALTPH